MYNPNQKERERRKERQCNFSIGSHRIGSHRIASHRITSHHIAGLGKDGRYDSIMIAIRHDTIQYNTMRHDTTRYDMMRAAVNENIRRERERERKRARIIAIAYCTRDVCCAVLLSTER